MPLDTGEKLVDYALSEVDEELRTVAVLYESDCNILYLRDDLRKKYSPDQYKRIADSFRINMRLERSNNETPIGAKRSIIHYHGNVFVFQFPHEDCHSLLMSVESSVGSRLKSFLSNCEDRI